MYLRQKWGVLCSGRGFMREPSWWQTLAWRLTRPWEEDDWASSVSLKKTSSGPTWNTAAMVRQHLKIHILLPSEYMLMFVSASVNAIRWQHMSVSRINSSRSCVQNDFGLGRLYILSSSPHSHRHHPGGFPGVQHSARRRLALKPGNKMTPDLQRVLLCVSASVSACARACVCVSVRLVRAYWCVQFLCLDDHEIRTVCAYHLSVSHPCVRLPVSSSSKLFHNYSLS